MTNAADGARASAATLAPGARVDFGDDALSSQVADGMARVEALLSEQLSGGHDFVTEKVRHLVDAGGKRFRPMFALLASSYGPNPCSDMVVGAATVVEVTHLATLYHDDVMDEAEKRRGVISANARWDNSVAILAGDFLLAKASKLMAQLGPATVDHFADTFGTLVTGQMRETIGPGEGDRVAHYTAVISEKTGVLIASAGYLGAMHSGADRATTECLQRLGAATGMIFQIVDDVIDIYSETTESGKTPGTDLREGVFTLPVLYAMAEDSDAGRELARRLTGPVADDDVPHILDLIRSTNARQRTLADIDHYVSLALEELGKLPDTAATKALRKVVDYSVSRVG